MKNFMYTKKIYVHETAGVNLSKIYSLKNPKKHVKRRFKSRLYKIISWKKQFYINHASHVNPQSAHFFKKFFENTQAISLYWFAA